MWVLAPFFCLLTVLKLYLGKPNTKNDKSTIWNGLFYLADWGFLANLSKRTFIRSFERNNNPELFKDTLIRFLARSPLKELQW